MRNLSILQTPKTLMAQPRHGVLRPGGAPSWAALNSRGRPAFPGILDYPCVFFLVPSGALVHSRSSKTLLADLNRETWENIKNSLCSFPPLTEALGAAR